MGQGPSAPVNYTGHMDAKTFMNEMFKIGIALNINEEKLVVDHYASQSFQTLGQFDYQTLLKDLFDEK